MSEANNPDREIARALALRGDPPPVTRLSRRAVLLLAGVAAGAVAGVAGWSLTTHRRPPDPTVVSGATTPVSPPAEVSELPKDYAALPPGVPKLGPPLPGDLGKPILAAGQAGVGAVDVSRGVSASAGAPPDPAIQQARQEALQARGSRLAVATGVRPGAPQAAPVAPAASEAVEGGGPENLAPATRTGPFTLQAGTTIRAALVTGLRSDIPGQVVAQVTEDVFDSLTGRHRLVPQGSRLVGSYQGRPGFGDERIAVTWQRLNLPDGRSIELQEAPAADAEGFAGLSDGVDRHWRTLLGGALVSTLLGTGAELGAGGHDSQVLEALRTGAATTANQAGHQLVGRSLDVPPTLTIRPGYAFRVLLVHDLVLEPAS